MEIIYFICGAIAFLLLLVAIGGVRWTWTAQIGNCPHCGKSLYKTELHKG